MSLLIRLIILPFRLLFYPLVKLRNLKKHAGAIYHHIPARFTTMRISGFLSQFLPRREANYLEYLVFLKSLSESDLLQTLVIQVPEMESSWAETEEVGRNLKAIRERGVQIIAYGEGGNLKTLYIMSIADQRYSAPHTAYTPVFPSAEPYFFKDSLKKLGVELEVYQAGKFKSAYETFTRTGFSPPAREALVTLLDDMTRHIETQIGSSAEGDPAHEKKLLKNIKDKTIIDAEELLALGFLEEVIAPGDIKSYLALGRKSAPHPGHIFSAPPQAAGADDSANPNSDAQDRQSPVALYHQDEKATRKFYAGEQDAYRRYRRRLYPAIRLRSLPSIAYVSMEGNIMPGKPGDTPRAEMISAHAYRELFERLENSREEAVFLHINSGGGSAQASELLYQSIYKLSRIKPVFAMLGGVAASGGYYIACAANRIYAPRTGITGSIGVISMHANMGKLYKRFGINKQRIGFGKTRDILSEAGALSPASRSLLKKHMAESYKLFLNRVAAGRSLDARAVDALAQGRIWSGERFAESGMIDACLDFSEILEEYKRSCNYKPHQEFRLSYYPEIRADLRTLAHQMPFGAGQALGQLARMGTGRGPLGVLLGLLLGEINESAPTHISQLSSLPGNLADNSPLETMSAGAHRPLYYTPPELLRGAL